MTTSESAGEQYAALRQLAEQLLSTSWTTFNSESSAAPGDLLGSQILLKSVDRKVVYVSSHLMKRFFAADELTLVSESSLLKDTEIDLFANADILTMQSGQSLTLAFKTTESDGREVRLLNHRIPLRGADGKPLGILCTYADIEPGDSGDSGETPGSAIDLNALVSTFDSLDERERSIARMLSRGTINKQLANHFNVSVRSIENWRRALLTKLKAETIADLTRIVVRFEDFGLMAPSKPDA